MYQALRAHIRGTWTVLRRSSLDAAPDVKVAGETSYLYIPRHEPIDAIAEKIRRRQALTGIKTPVHVRHLPDHHEKITQHGVLYLPNDYIVPGGRFNEMYGWDSYWIIKGLIRDGHFDLAKGMVDNCLYEIENYGGKMLNGNRTYYDRAHPPVLALIVQDYLPYVPGDEKSAFLKRALAALVKNYEQFWKIRRFTESTGLFHYGHPDEGKLGLCPEVIYGECDPATGFSHYDKIIAQLRTLPVDDPLRQKLYDAETDALSVYAIAGDRAMRESGFDPSMHLGFYGLETHDKNPICLNSLLYLHCKITAQFAEHGGDIDESAKWKTEADRLAVAIGEKLWNEEQGLYMGFDHRTDELCDYIFLSSAYPLMAGLATPEQARLFRDRVVSEFETEYGLRGTPRVDGCQWELMWAPLVDITAEGLRRYGYEEDADRIEKKFLNTVNRIFHLHKVVYEKYDALSGTSQTAAVEVGYDVNVIGFGWTNAVAAGVIDRLAKP